MRITMDELEYDNSQRRLYRGIPYTGTAWEFYVNGEVMTEQTFREGVPHGVSRAYRPGERIESERWHDYGRRNGRWRTWHENGRLADELIYERGHIVSRSAWTEDGRPIDH